jgi:threonine/homoserine/homoserine lactone efflux protein
MFGTHDLALFALTTLVVNATPGVDLMFTLASTLRSGLRGGLAASLGIAAGCVVHTLGAAFGLAALLAASVSAFTVVKAAGALYLAWLAFGMLRDAVRRGDAAGALPPAPAASLRRTFRQALLTNVLNPKVAIFFLALLPQFIDANAPHKTAAFVFLGAWFIAQGLSFLVAFVLLVAPLRRWQPSSAWRRSLQAGGGLLFAGLAARLALTERP